MSVRGVLFRFGLLGGVPPLGERMADGTAPPPPPGLRVRVVELHPHPPAPRGRPHAAPPPPPPAPRPPGPRRARGGAAGPARCRSSWKVIHGVGTSPAGATRRPTRSCQRKVALRVRPTSRNGSRATT